MKPFGLGPLLAVAVTAAALPLPVLAQQSRQDIAAEQRRARSEQLQPREPGRVERTFLMLSDERLLDRLFDPRHGFFVRVGLPVEGAAFGAGPAWRASDPGRYYTFTVSAVGSISREWLGEVSLHLPNLLPRAAPDRWFADLSLSRSGRVENEFWGLGNSSDPDARTLYRNAQTIVGGTLGVRLMPWLSAAASASRLAPRITAPSSSTPSINDVFDESTAPGLTRQPAFLTSGIILDLDYLDSIPSSRTAVRLDRLPLTGASRGGRYKTRLLSYRDRDFDQYSFRRTTVDLQQFLPLLHGHRVFAFRALAILSHTEQGQEVPFYLSPTYGGLNVGRGFRTFRFRDRNMLALQAEYRYQVNPLIGGAIFVDTGQVAERTRAFGWAHFKTTYGTGVRLGALGAAALRFDVAFGGDGPTFIFALGHAF